MDVRTNAHRQLTFDGSRDILSPAVVSEWEMDCFRLRARTGSMDIYRMDANGKNVKQLTDMGTCGKRPAWSPDSQSIAFTSSRFLFVMDTEGKRLKRLVAADAFAHCTWSPDGKQIAFSANVGGWKEELFSIEVNGKGIDSNSPGSINPHPSPNLSGRRVGNGSPIVSSARILKVEPVIGPGNFGLPVIYVIDTAGDGLTEPLESTKRLAAYSSRVGHQRDFSPYHQVRRSRQRSGVDSSKQRIPPSRCLYCRQKFVATHTISFVFLTG